MKRTAAFVLSLLLVLGCFSGLISVRSAEADSAYYVSAEGQEGMPDSMGLKSTTTTEAYKQTTGNFTAGKDYIIAVISSTENNAWFAMGSARYTDESTSGHGAGMPRQAVTVSGSKGSYVLSIPANASIPEAQLLWRASASETSNYFHLYNSTNAAYLYRYGSSGYWLTTRDYSSTSAGGDNWQYSYSELRAFASNKVSYGFGFNKKDSDATGVLRFDSGEDNTGSLVYGGHQDTYLFTKQTTEATVDTFVTLKQGSDVKTQTVSYLANIKNGDSVTLSASVTNAPGNVSYTYRSSNTNVAAIDQNGVVTFTGKAGTVYFTVEAVVTKDGTSYTLTDHAMWSVSTDSVTGDSTVSYYTELEGLYGMPDSMGIRISKGTETFLQATTNFQDGQDYIIAVPSTVDNGDWYALTSKAYTDEETSGHGAGMYRQKVNVSGSKGNYVLTVPAGATYAVPQLLWHASASETSSYFHLYNTKNNAYLYRYGETGYWLTTRDYSSATAGGDNWQYSYSELRAFSSNAVGYGLGFNRMYDAETVLRFDSGYESGLLQGGQQDTYLFVPDSNTSATLSYVTLKQGATAVSQTVTPLTNISEGSTLTLSANVIDAPSGVSYSYRSSDTNIATVDSNGVVTFTGERGTVYITAEATVTCNGKPYKLTDHALYAVSNTATEMTSTVSYYVTEEAHYGMPDSMGVVSTNLTTFDETRYGIQLTRDGGVASQSLKQYTSVAQGFSINHEASLYDASATNFVWTTSDPDVATVDSNGKLTFTGESGMVILTVSYDYVIDGENYTVTDHVAYTFSTTEDRVPFTDMNDADNFPHYPDPGSVRIDKGVTDTSVYADYGVAQVELAVSGIPKSEPVDVVLVIDISNSMSKAPASDSSISKMTLSKNAASAFANTLLLSDGVANQNRLAIVTFCDYGTTAMEMTEASKLSTIQSTISNLSYAGSSYGGTNYDEGLYEALNVLNDARTDGIGNNRRQCVVFLTDGAPGIYNRASVDMYDEWVLDSDFSTVVLDFDDYLFNSSTDLSHQSSSAPLTAFKYKTNSQLSVRHRSKYSTDPIWSGNWFTLMEYLWNDWVQGSLSESDWSLTPSGIDILPSKIEPYLHGDNIYAAAIKGKATQAQLNSWGISSGAQAEIYTIGLDLSAGSFMINATNGSVDLTAAQCTELLQRIASSDEHQMDATDEDTLMEIFTQIASTLNAAASDSTVTDEMGAQFDLQTAPFVLDENGNAVQTGITPTIQVGYWSLDPLTRERLTYTLLEEFTFTTNNAGKVTAVSSSLTGSCFNAANNAFSGSYLSYDFDTETFSYDLDIGIDQEVTLTYWVYLTGAYEGTRTTGSYNTNEVATLSYSNYLKNPCIQTFPVPVLPWGGAQVSYNYYLVNESGEPVNRNGDVIPFAERIVVSETDTLTFPYNNTQQVYARRAVPNGYTLYAKDAYYTVMASTSGNDEAIIVDPTETTYVVSPNVTNETNKTLTLSNYYATTVTFPVYLSESMNLSFDALGAQAHIIHKTEALDTAPLYTDGIRFGIEVKADELKKALNVGERFNFAIMVQPAYKLGGFESYWEYVPGLHDDSTRVMTCNVSSDGVVAPDNCSIVFCGKSSAVFSTREVVDGRPRYTLDSSNMITWTRAMENASSNAELIRLLREAGLVIFEANETDTGFRYVVKLMYDRNDASFSDKAACELAYRGFFLKLDESGDYVINTTHQRVNSAQRIFRHYSYERFGVGTEDDLNGWSTYTPKLRSPIVTD